MTSLGVDLRLTRVKVSLTAILSTNGWRVDQRHDFTNILQRYVVEKILVAVLPGKQFHMKYQK